MEPFFFLKPFLYGMYNSIQFGINYNMYLCVIVCVGSNFPPPHATPTKPPDCVFKTPAPLTPAHAKHRPLRLMPQGGNSPDFVH